jgi:PAS domain S-box-containing protein
MLVRELRKAGYQVQSQRVVSSVELATALTEPWDIIVSDWLLPGFGGEQALAHISKSGHAIPVIVISGTPGEEPAVTALRAGALDFLAKDKPSRYVPAIERAVRESADRRARLEAERALRLSETRYRLGFEIAPEALITYDLTHEKILDANPAAIELFGYTLDELRSMAVGKLSMPVQAEGVLVRDAIRNLFADARAGEVVIYEWRYVGKNGELIPCEVRFVPMPAGEGIELARLSIIDLRERMRTEEIKRRSVELELQNRRIEEASRLKSEFLANMSHELRTPLNAIIGFAELLHDGQVEPTSPQHTEFLGDILTSGRHLLQLINDVLDLAKVEAGKLDFRPEVVDPAKMINEVAAILRTAAAVKRIRVHTEVDDNVGMVTIDPSRFKQVVYNYLSNALKFTPESGRIDVRVSNDDASHFRLEVEDTGVGIPPEELGRLFVEFQQLESGSSKRHQGTGLGLALTRRLVEAQGGRVGVRSSPGIGSTFHAVLPRETRAGVDPGPKRPPAQRLGAKTVLVVEDESRDRELIVEQLDDAGFGVEIATTGAEALELCAEREFDAITLDMLLPDMTGLELLSQLRTEARTRAVPVVVVTVVPDAKVVAGFMVADVLHKPLESAELLRALERAGVRPDRAGGVLVVDDDPAALRLMDATLAKLGLAAITRSTGASGLEAAARLAPSAVVLDLMMPEMDGLEFLSRLREMPAHKLTPVMIWTSKELTATERDHLRAICQGVAAKNDNGNSGIVAQLRQLFAGVG